MANTILTPTAVLREVLRVAHEKASFIGTIQRQYDSSFAKSGAKIGDSLKIRLPNEYTVRTGKTLSTQDTTESSVTLAVATQKGVDVSFSSAELTMDLQDFSKRIIEPAMSVLMSTLDSDALTSMTKEVYNHVGTPGTAPTFAQIAKAKAKLNQNLAPKNMAERHIQMESVDMATSVDALKALFHDPKQIQKQYREGVIGTAAGLNWTENERAYSHTTGSDLTSVTINDAGSLEGVVSMTSAGGNFTAGDIFTMAGAYSVHPETKATMASLKQFVVTTAGTTTLAFTPALISTGAKQNVSALPANGAALVFVGTASTAYPNALTYHSEAFAWASADLELPKGVDFAARENMDGISARIVRAYDISNDLFPCRIDILHGFKAIRPQWACRSYGSGA